MPVRAPLNRTPHHAPPTLDPKPTHPHCWPAMAIFSKPARLLPSDFVQKQRRPLVLAAFVVVLLRSRLGEIGKEGLDAVVGKLSKGKGKAGGKLSKEEMERVLQKIYEEDPRDEERKVLLVPYRDRVTKVSAFEWIGRRC